MVVLKIELLIFLEGKKTSLISKNRTDTRQSKSEHDDKKNTHL